MHEFDKSVPVDIVFRVKQSYYRSDFNSIRLELLDLLKRIKI